MKYSSKRKIVQIRKAGRAINKSFIQLADALLIALQFILHYTEFFLESLVKERTQRDGYLMSPRKVLSFFNKGIRLGDMALSHKNSLMHAIIYGPTGSGKSSQIFYNNYLINRNASLIIRNVAGDFLQTAGYLKSVGYKIVNINLKDAMQCTDAVNMLRGLLSKADISRIAKQIVGAVYQKSDYWGMSAEEYCSIFIGLLKEQNERFHNLLNLKYIVESYIADETSLDYLIAKSKNEDLVNGFMAMAATPEKTRLSSLSTLKSCFARIDENIALATSSSTFDWQQLRYEKTAVFIESSVLDDGYLNMIQSLMYTDILKSLMDHGLPKPGDLPVYIYLDECSSLSIGTILQTAFLNARKYQISITTAFQDPAVLRSAYSKEIAQTLEANAFAKIYGSPDKRGE